MERFDASLHLYRHRPFDAVPAGLKRRVFGVDYVQLRGRQSGDLYITRHGWPALTSIVPSHWFAGDRLSKVGRQLAGATGAVYRVPVPHQTSPRYALVAKFSRFAQEALVSLGPAAIADWGERDRIAASEFLSPFEEFSHLERLRAAAGAAIPTNTPLAIYSPPTRYLDWELGRRAQARWRYDRSLAADQAEQPETARVRYDWERLYILLYRWLDGIDAEVATQQGYLTQPALVDLTEGARAHLRRLGWDVLDHKPRHLIVRAGGAPGRLLSRGGRIIWGLVDYELLMAVRATA